MFDKAVAFLSSLFYVFLALAVLPVTLTSIFHRMIEPEIPFFHILGFIGALFMLSFAAYMARKKNWIKFGKPVTFLKVHILLALSGSAVALAHSTLRLSAFNTKVLVVAVTLIVTSGIIGRYLFARLNNLKNGMEVSLQQLAASWDEFRSTSLPSLSADESRAFESTLLSPGPESSRSFFVGLAVLLYREIRIRMFPARDLPRGLSGDELKRFKSIVLKGRKLDNAVKMLSLTKGLFAKWKKVHVPFTVILFLTLAIHITTQYLFGNVRLFRGG